MTDLATLRKDAKLAYKARAYTAAADLYGRVLEAGSNEPPESIAADRVGYASVLLAQDRMAEAAAELEAAVPHLPLADRARMSVKLGEIMARLGRHREAATHFEEACRIAPEDADYQWRLAVELRALGRDREAVAALRRCLEIDPNHTQGLILEMEVVALSSPERDGQAAEAMRSDDDDIPEVSDRMLRRPPPGMTRGAQREAEVMAAAARRPTGPSARRQWLLAAQAVALLIGALWVRTLFP